jgi:hypothetical protein
MFRAVMVVAITCLMVSCRTLSMEPGATTGPSPTGDIPSETPSIRGVITAIDSIGRLRIEENPSEDFGSAKAVVRITADTRVLSQSGGATTTDALSVGMRVLVWYHGPVAESYPVQAAANVVVIESSF